jgi:hypothetical protein
MKISKKRTAVTDRDEHLNYVREIMEQLAAEGRLVKTNWIRRGQPVYVTPRNLRPEHFEHYVFPDDLDS